MKKNIAIVGGGFSSEAEISINSAFNLSSMMNNDIYNFYVVFIDENKWVVKDETEDIPVNKADFSFQKNEHKITFDCAYITIHGTPGEDGRLQSYFELIGMPYTSCDVFTSNLTFNKFATKVFLKEYDILSAEAVLLRKDDEIVPTRIISKVGIPCFVKPNNGGSSFGVSKVTSQDQLETAIKKALEEDNEVIIESFIDGLELTNGAYKYNNIIEVLPITEIQTNNDFFDYEAKYKNQSKEITPANIPDELTEECKQLTETIYKVLNCKGIVRVDYILSEGELFVLEINTVPGLSKESIIPQQIRAAGKKEYEVFGLLIEEAMKHK